MSVDIVMVPCPKCMTIHPFPSSTGQKLNITYSLADAPGDVMDGINQFAPMECEHCGIRYWVKKFPDKHRPMEWTPTCELEKERWNI